MNIAELLKVIQAAAPIIEGIIEGGTKALAAVKAALKDNGVDADTAELDAIIADADARRKRAERESQGL